MRAVDILVLSLRQLKERKLRSILTVLAIAVGVTTIIALSAQAEGVRVGITQDLAMLGPNSILIQGRPRTPFTDLDVLRLKELPGVSSVTPVMTQNAQVAGLTDPAPLVGISYSDLETVLGEIRLRDGYVYYDVAAPQALIGYDVAVDDTGQIRYQAGQPILVQIGQRSPMLLIVVGVLDTYGSALMIQPDRSIFLPREYITAIIPTSGYRLILVKTESSETVGEVTDLIGAIFGGRARIISIAQITETVINVTSSLSLLLIGIAGTSFIAAGLGTFNIMMISVLERVREIGILKALGMKDKGVLFLYITQGLLLGLFGSLTGVGLGTMMAYALPTFLGGGGIARARPPPSGGPPPGGGAPLGMGSYTPVIRLTYLGISIAVSIVVTFLSSAYPAWKASKMSPVDALRYE